MRLILLFSVLAISSSMLVGGIPQMEDRMINENDDLLLQKVIGDPAQAAYTFRATFDVPFQIKEWASLSLTAVGDRAKDESLFMMALLRQQNKRAAVGFYPDNLVDYPLSRSTRALTLEAVLYKKMLYLTVWKEGSAKPENPQAMMRFPFQTLSGFGVRSYALKTRVRNISLKAEATLPESVRESSLLDGSSWAKFSPDGIIRNLTLKGRDIPMIPWANYNGPALSVLQAKNGQPIRLPMKRVKGEKGLYQAKLGENLFSLRYAFKREALTIEVETKNLSETESFRPERLSLLLGISPYMASYPQWDTQHFPTFLKAEPAGFFWGYAMSPLGRMVGIFSPDSVDSWHLLYNNGGHRINGISLDLTSAEKRRLTGKNCYGLPPQASEKKRIILEDIPSLEEFPRRAACWTGADITLSDRYTLLPYETYTTTTYKPDGRVSAEVHPGRVSRDKLTSADYGERLFQPAGKANAYRIIYRHPWSWYLDEARKAIVKAPQKAGSHIEGWYGFLHAFQWRALNPAPDTDQKIDDQFANLFGMMYPNAQTMRPHGKTLPSRIQNHAGAASAYAFRYSAKRDIRDLEKASKLIDFLLSRQSRDGAYRADHIHYTSVIYVAKFLADAMYFEQELGKSDPVWQKRFERHYASVERSIDELARNLDNIQTEGEMTFEDGMISCTYTQLADWALRWAKPEKRQIYIDAAEKVAAKHRCLSQKIQPDGRMNGASLRFWESQYDVLYCKNMMTSPHGWSSWRLYGLFDLYRLTGKTGYLYDAMNGIGACANLLNTVTTSPETPTLHWAYQMDDLLETTPFEQSITEKGKGVFVPRTLLSDYRPMISNWFRAPQNKMVWGYSPSQGGSCDNEVHEVFKCIVEKVVRTTFVIFRTGKEPVVFNGSVEKCGEGHYKVLPSEKFVDEIHVNTDAPLTVEAAFQSKPLTRKLKSAGMASILRK